MKIPKKIMHILERREKLAVELIDLNAELTDWLNEQGADLGDSDIADATLSGCLIYCEPCVAKKAVERYIEEKL